MCVYPKERILTWNLTSDFLFLPFRRGRKSIGRKGKGEVIVLPQKSTVADFNKRKERMTVAMRRKNYVRGKRDPRAKF